MRAGSPVLLALLAGCSLVTSFEGFTGIDDALTPEDEGGLPGPTDAAGDSSPFEEAGLADTNISETGHPDSGVRDADADAPVVQPGSPRLEQTKTATTDSSSLTTTFAATKAGSLLVLGIGHEDTAIVAIADNFPGESSTYVRAGTPGSHSNCAGHAIGAQIWYAKNVRAGVTAVTVTFSGAAPAQLWLMEFSNMSATAPLDATQSMNDGALSTSLNAPKVTPTVPDAVVVSTAVCCSTITGLKSGSPFTGLSVLDGNSTAYLLAKQSGTYGASWNTDNCVSGATTAAFK